MAIGLINGEEALLSLLYDRLACHVVNIMTEKRNALKDITKLRTIPGFDSTASPEQKTKINAIEAAMNLINIDNYDYLKDPTLNTKT